MGDWSFSWENKVERESEKAFNYFIKYLELGEKRSLAKLRDSTGNNISLRQLKTYSSKYRWQERINEKMAYDRTLESQKLKEDQADTLEDIGKSAKVDGLILQSSQERLLYEAGLVKDKKTGEYIGIPTVDIYTVCSLLPQLIFAKEKVNNQKLRAVKLPKEIKDNNYHLNHKGEFKSEIINNDPFRDLNIYKKSNEEILDSLSSVIKDDSD